MIIGNIARKKLNDMDEARVVMDPLKIPWKKKLATLYKGMPSKPGIITLFVNCKNFKTGLIRRILNAIGRN